MYQHEHRHQNVVVTATPAAADFVAVTLAAHGIRATTMAYDHAYPSVDWVRGYRIGVPEEDAARARQILDALSGRDDVAVLDPDEEPPQ